MRAHALVLASLALLVLATTTNPVDASSSSSSSSSIDMPRPPPPGNQPGGGDGNPDYLDGMPPPPGDNTKKSPWYKKLNPFNYFRKKKSSSADGLNDEAAMHQSQSYRLLAAAEARYAYTRDKGVELLTTKTTTFDSEFNLHQGRVSSPP